MTNLPAPVPAWEVPGNFVTAALWTSQVTNPVSFLTSPPMFVGVQTAAQSMTSTPVPILLDTSPADTYGGHSTVSNTSRYVCQLAGWYTIGGCISFAANATGVRKCGISVNGVQVPGTAHQGPASGTYQTTIGTPVRDVYLNVNDYVELMAFVYPTPTTAAPLATSCAGDQSSTLWVRFSHA